MQIGGEEGDIDHEEKAAKRSGQPPGPLPRASHHDEEDQGRHDHGGSHRDAVSGGEGRAGFEAVNGGDGPERERDVDEREIDLAGLVRVGVLDREAGEITELHRLADQRVSAQLNLTTLQEWKKL